MRVTDRVRTSVPPGPPGDKGKAASAPRQRVIRLLVDRGLLKAAPKREPRSKRASSLPTIRPCAEASEEIANRRRLRASVSPPLRVARRRQARGSALDHFGFDPKGQHLPRCQRLYRRIREVLLDRGARLVYAVDVGRAQLHRHCVPRPEITFRSRPRRYSQPFRRPISMNSQTV